LLGKRSLIPAFVSQFLTIDHKAVSFEIKDLIVRAAGCFDQPSQTGIMANFYDQTVLGSVVL